MMVTGIRLIKVHYLITDIYNLLYITHGLVLLDIVIILCDYIIFLILKFTIKFTLSITIVFLSTVLKFSWHAYCIMLTSACTVI